MEQQESAKFIQYMAKKLKVSSQKELEDALTNMGEEKLKAAYDEYKQGGDEPTEYGDGGSLEYIKCLNFLKKGGVMDCGCGSKMKKGGPVVPKAFLGALLGAGKALMAGSKLAGTGIKAMGTMAKAGKFMGNASKVMNAGQQILGVAQQFKNPTPGITQQLPTTQVGINPGIAPALNPVIAQNTPTLGAQSIPTLTPAGQQIQPVKPMYSEDGGKLDKIKKLNSFKGKKTKGLEGPGATMMHKEGGKVSEFGAAFKASRSAGEKEFTFKGKRYNTKTKEDDDKAARGKGTPVPEAKVTAKKPIGKNINVPEVKVTAKRLVPKTNVPEAKVTANRVPTKEQRAEMQKKVTPRPEEILSRSGKVFTKK